MATQLFRDACLQIVLSPNYLERLYGARSCGIYAAKVSKEECEACLDKRAQVKETWPGVGALVHAMEDEFPAVRVEAIKAIGLIAQAWPLLRNKCVQVALEGLQDTSKNVRLSSAKIALACQPKEVRAAELRLLLETCTSDESEAVKDAVLDVLLFGPSFSEAAHAVTTVEWLASLQNPIRFMYRFGQKHSELLYLSSNSLIHCKENHREGCIAALAGAFSVWGIPNFFKGAALSEEILALNQHLQEDEVRQKLVCSLIHASIYKGQPAEGLEKYPAAFGFVQMCLGADASDARQRVLRQWTGFTKQSMVHLNAWALEGRLPSDAILIFDDIAAMWTNGMLPARTDFELHLHVDFLPHELAPLGIVRLRVHVTAKHVNPNAKWVLRGSYDDDWKQSTDLVTLEIGRQKVLFEQVSLAVPVRGAFQLQRLKISPELA